MHPNGNPIDPMPVRTHFLPTSANFDTSAWPLLSRSSKSTATVADDDALPVDYLPTLAECVYPHFLQQDCEYVVAQNCNCGNCWEGATLLESEKCLELQQKGKVDEKHAVAVPHHLDICCMEIMDYLSHSRNVVSTIGRDECAP